MSSIDLLDNYAVQAPKERSASCSRFQQQLAMVSNSCEVSFSMSIYHPCVCAGWFLKKSLTETTVAVVDHEVGSQGSGGEVVHAAGAVGHVPHHDGVRVRKPEKPRSSGWEWIVIALIDMQNMEDKTDSSSFWGRSSFRLHPTGAVSQGLAGDGPEWHGATRLLLITTSERPEGGTSCLAVKGLPDQGR